MLAMKVFLIARGFPTARSPQWGCFERDQAEALVSVGNEVVVLSVDTRFRLFWRKPGISCHTDRGIHFVNCFLMPSSVVGLLGKSIRRKVEQWQLRKVYEYASKRFGRPDILYSHYLFITANAVQLKQRYGVPLVAIEHWSELAKKNLPESMIQSIRKIYTKLDRLITVSPALQQNIIKQIGQPSEVVYNVVGSEFQYNEKPRHRSRVRYITVGSLNNGKRFDVMLDALSNLNGVDSNWELVLIGEGTERTRLESQVHRLGLDGQVRFLGRLTKSEIARQFLESDVFLLSSQMETFSVVCIEAMACGLPIVATRCGGPESIVQEADGLLCPINDADAFFHALVFMQQNFLTYDRRNIAERCLQRFGAEVIGRQLSSIFLDVVQHSTSSHSN
jgi:glycosyltransferase involved in cell wall biosynthesis